MNVFPCSPGQERLWFLDRLDPGSPVYHVPTVLRLSGPLDVEALRRAFATISTRHAALRTVFRERDGVPEQVVTENGFSFTVRSAGEDSVAPEAAAEIRVPFDLTAGPLARVLLLRTAEDQHVLVVTLHHAIADGWSVSLLLDELAESYRAELAGSEPDLPPLPMQYADFVRWQREHLDGPEGVELLREWADRLRGAPELITLPTDRPRPATAAYGGGIHEFRFPPALTEAVRTLADTSGATVFMTVLAAYHALLARYSGQDDVVVGTVVGQRSQVDTERLIGFFVNTVPVRISTADDPTFAELLLDVCDALVDALGGAEIPFERVVEAVRPERSLGHSPIYQVGFNGHGDGALPQLAGLTVTDFAGPHTGTAKLDLMLGVRDEGDCLHGYLEYRTDLFDEATIVRFAEHLCTFLSSVTVDPAQQIGAVSLLDSAQRRAALDSGLTRPLPAAATALDLIAPHVRDRGSAPAIAGSLTYRELDARANRLAHALRRRGVGPDVPVGLCVRRSAEMVVALLAVWKAGGAYVPLDPEWPLERHAYVVEEADVRIAVVDRENAGRLPRFETVLDVDLDYPEPDTAPEVAHDPADLAYLVYTSGSTGRPKGVAVPHRGVVNLLTGLADRLGVTEDDVWASVTTLAFDMSVRELLIPLIRGGTVAVISTEDSAEPVVLARRLADCGATILQATPTRWRMLLASGGVPANVRERLCGGEALDRELVEALSDGRVWNLYGPTEVTMIVAAGTVSTAAPVVPLGPPLPNTRLHVLDAGLNPVPPGVAGEIFVGGAGISRGYRSRPGLTAERFVPDPFAADGSRLYATGDLARRRADGTLEFLGRTDHQVKIRGLRIELGEIEARLRADPQVSDAVVLARPAGPDDVRLVAYVVSEDTEWAPLRDRLSGQLPAYLVPQTAVFLPALPLTKNGKTDRTALPEPVWESREADRVAPRDAVERELAKLWREVLAVEDVGVHDDFFRLGGHSLLAARLLAKVREHFRSGVGLRTLFAARTIAAFAAALRAAESAPGAADEIALLRERIAALPDDEVLALLHADSPPGAHR
ncbi:non-ribosomal peptide synthetase [Amycolatopsis dendrobii]|uniref:Amino acid adenylation domain-containing protein n=1 Tax=Amycolatopsis dendrobii TaxID=2760662 RepID=A0A7W3VXH7_9PSEU|nr:non-ribosomal peptide synthetase [Amycolatopsis dendrobii]MBB1154502.1 amino acid adenylation domain-containing protein [Amycolatopsis dendrobii]